MKGMIDQDEGALGNQWEILSDMLELGLVFVPRNANEPLVITEAVQEITRKFFWRYDGTRSVSGRKSANLLTGSPFIAGNAKMTYTILDEEPNVWQWGHL